MVEAALLVGPQAGQRAGPVHVGRRPVGLEVVDADLAARVQVLTRLGEGRRHVAGRALGPAVEQRLAAGCRHRRRTSPSAASAPAARAGRPAAPAASELTRSTGAVTCPKPFSAAIGNWAGVVQPRVEERALAVHLQHRDERVPVRDRAPAGPGVQVDPGQPERRRDQRRRRPARWAGTPCRPGTARRRTCPDPRRRAPCAPSPRRCAAATRPAAGSGTRPMIAPTLRSRLAQPSSRWPMPGANELSTVE